VVVVVDLGPPWVDSVDYIVEFALDDEYELDNVFREQ